MIRPSLAPLWPCRLLKNEWLATIKICLVLVLLVAGGVRGGVAAEIDSVTPRGLALDDSLAVINALVNARLEQGVARANARQDDYEDLASGEFCEEQVLYTELRKAIFQSLTASWGLKGYALDQQLREELAGSSHSLPLRDSIYRDINYLEGFSLRLKDLSDVVNIDGHLVGLDKIGHFFAEGWHYFELSGPDQDKLNRAMAWGRAQEAGKFGYTTTSIFSHADLVANFNGWRFWLKVLGQGNDPLKGLLANLFSRAYVTCDLEILASIRHRKIVKAWQINSRFDLADYLDGAWDENNNCNSYRDPVVEAKVTARIHEVDADFHCPARPDYCLAARKKYGDQAGELLHPLCLAAKP
jgi:hypothetical protein